MEFVDRLLEEDIRNNSAWNQRHFVVVNTTSYTPEVLAAEVNYAKAAIKKAVHNESPWNYLRGILMQELDQAESPMYLYPGKTRVKYKKNQRKLTKKTKTGKKKKNRKTVSLNP